MITHSLELRSTPDAPILPHVYIVIMYPKEVLIRADLKQGYPEGNISTVGLVRCLRPCIDTASEICCSNVTRKIMHGLEVLDCACLE